MDRLDYLCLENVMWVATTAIGIPAYDFDFANFFRFKRLWFKPEGEISVTGRFGVVYDYDRIYKALAKNNILLIHTPDQHWRAANLDAWYSLLQDLTARSLWFDTPPPVERVEREFGYPVFVRGTFQTNQHRASLSVVRSREDYQRAVTAYCTHRRLRRQKFVVRELLSLRPAEPKVATDLIAPSFEFRSFWWKGELVGFGPYWSAIADYDIAPSERIAAISLAKQAADRVAVPFLVVDIAQKANGEWVLIECNDGQESSYAGISPFVMWQKIVEVEQRSRMPI